MRCFSAFCCTLLLTAGLAAQDTDLEFAYYPLEVGTTWQYRVSDDVNKQSKKVTVRVIKRTKLKWQDKDEKLLTDRAAVLEMDDGKRTLTEEVAVFDDGLYRFSTAGRSIRPPFRFFKFSRAEQDSWTCEATAGLGNAIKLEGTLTRKEGVFPMSFPLLPMMGPSPTYPVEQNAFIVSCDDFHVGKKRMSLRSWYVRGIGMVKQWVKIGDFERTLELERFVPGEKSKS